MVLYELLLALGKDAGVGLSGRCLLADGWTNGFQAASKRLSAEGGRMVKPDAHRLPRCAT